MNLTNAGVKGGVYFEDIASRKVDSITSKAEVAAESGFWMHLRNSFSLSRGTGSFKRTAY